jgi:hypothetical protein
MCFRINTGKWDPIFIPFTYFSYKFLKIYTHNVQLQRLKMGTNVVHAEKISRLFLCVGVGGGAKHGSRFLSGKCMKMYQTLQDFNRHICSLVNCGHNYLDASHDSKFGTKIYKWFISPTIQKTAHQIELWQITYLTRLKVPTMVPRQKKRYQQWFKIQYDK